MMTAPTDAPVGATASDFEALHALRIKGLTTDAALTHLLGLDESAAADVVSGLVGAGLALRREGPRLSGTALSPAGRERHAALLGQRRALPGYAEQLTAALAAFRPINGQFKQLCLRWQTLDDGSPNLHADAEHDDAVVRELGELQLRAGALLADMTAEPRLRRYADRLEATLDRLRGGDRSAFLRPMSESYHDVWMELHEDLILCAGAARGDDDEG